MKKLLKLEDLFLFFLSIFLFSQEQYPWWVYPALLLTPDLSMLGYLGGPVIGAFTYNFVHHRGLGILLYALGFYLAHPVLRLAGIILFGHTNLDRVFGYGLKYTDNFKHTHLGELSGSHSGKIGRPT